MLCTLVILTTASMGYAIDPVQVYSATPETFGLASETLKISTADGAALHAWLMRTTSEDRKASTVLIAGGDAGNMGYSLPYAASLLAAGYDVLTFDYRGFGESSDFAFDPDFLYHEEYITDFVAVVSWAQVQLELDEIAVLAFSMGTLVATVGYECVHYDYLVGESFVACPKQIVRRIQQRSDKVLQVPPSAKASCNGTSGMDIPILLFASRTDELTTAKDSEVIVAEKPNRKLVLHDGDHLRAAYTLGLDNFTQAIVDLVP